MNTVNSLLRTCCISGLPVVGLQWGYITSWQCDWLAVVQILWISLDVQLPPPQTADWLRHHDLRNLQRKWGEQDQDPDTSCHTVSQSRLQNSCRPAPKGFPGCARSRRRVDIVRVLTDPAGLDDVTMETSSVQFTSSITVDPWRCTQCSSDCRDLQKDKMVKIIPCYIYNTLLWKELSGTENSSDNQRHHPFSTPTFLVLREEEKKDCRLWGGYFSFFFFLQKCF